MAKVRMTEQQFKEFVDKLVRARYKKIISETKVLRENKVKKLDGVSAVFDADGKFIEAHLPQGMSGEAYGKWRMKHQKELGIVVKDKNS